jgi:nicotinamide riboside kinase
MHKKVGRSNALSMRQYTKDELDSVRAIYVVGPSSAGKTTLCNALVKQLGIPPDAFVTEVARTVMREKGLTRADVGQLSMQRAIVDAHVARDRDARRSALDACIHDNVTTIGRNHGAVMVSDRSAIDAVVYAMMNSEALGRALIDSPGFRTMLDTYRSERATFVLLHPVANWVIDDGVRSIDSDNAIKQFIRVLQELKLRYMSLGEMDRLLEMRVGVVRLQLLI